MKAKVGLVGVMVLGAAVGTVRAQSAGQEPTKPTIMAKEGDPDWEEGKLKLACVMARLWSRRPEGA